MKYNTCLFKELSENDEMKIEGGAIIIGPFLRNSGGSGNKLPWWIPIIIL